MKNQFLLKIIAVVIVVLLCILLCFSLLRGNQSDNNPTLDTKTQEEIDDTDDVSKDSAHAKMLDEASTSEDEGEKLFNIPKEDVYSFSITDSNGILLDFEKDKDEWICVGNEDLDIDEERVDKILNYLCDIRFVEMFSSDDGSEYGLTEESDIFIVEDAGGNDVIVSLGNTEADGSVYFALNYDFTKVFKNSGKLKNVCEYAIQELL